MYIIKYLPSNIGRYFFFCLFYAILNLNIFAQRANPLGELFMINEERVRHMTSMAIFEKELGPEYQPMLKYSKKEYLALHGWGGFLGGTIFYAVIYAAVILYIVSKVLENITTMYILLMVLLGLLFYAFYIIIHVHNTRRRAAKQYKMGKRLIKELAEKYSVLNLMYEDEAQQTKPLLARNKQDLEDLY